MELVDETLEIVELKVQDIRWPTSKGNHGSDAMVRPIKECAEIKILITIGIPSTSAPGSRLFLRVCDYSDQRRGVPRLWPDFHPGPGNGGGRDGRKCPQVYRRRPELEIDLQELWHVLAGAD